MSHTNSSFHRVLVLETTSQKWPTLFTYIRILVELWIENIQENSVADKMRRGLPVYTIWLLFFDEFKGEKKRLPGYNIKKRSPLKIWYLFQRFIIKIQLYCSYLYSVSILLLLIFFVVAMFAFSLFIFVHLFLLQ